MGNLPERRELLFLLPFARRCPKAALCVQPYQLMEWKPLTSPRAAVKSKTNAISLCCSARAALLQGSQPSLKQPVLQQELRKGERPALLVAWAENNYSSLQNLVFVTSL